MRRLLVIVSASALAVAVPAWAAKPAHPTHPSHPAHSSHPAGGKGTGKGQVADAAVTLQRGNKVSVIVAVALRSPSRRRSESVTPSTRNCG